MAKAGIVVVSCAVTFVAWRSGLGRGDSARYSGSCRGWKARVSAWRAHKSVWGVMPDNVLVEVDNDDGAQGVP